MISFFEFIKWIRKQELEAWIQYLRDSQIHGEVVEYDSVVELDREEK